MVFISKNAIKRLYTLKNFNMVVLLIMEKAKNLVHSFHFYTRSSGFVTYGIRAKVTALMPIWVQLIVRTHEDG